MYFVLVDLNFHIVSLHSFEHNFTNNKKKENKKFFPLALFYG